MPIVTKQKITTTPKQRNKLLVEHPQMDAIIKSVRTYVTNGMIHMDYRVHYDYRVGGKDRTRFSTGIAYSKRAIQRVEREMFSAALEHYLQTTNIMDGASLRVGDIALDAINEDKGNRQDDVHNDYLKIYDVYIKPIFEYCILNEVKVSDVKAWKNNLLETHALSRSRYLKYARVLSFIFKFAMENEMIDKNPASLVDKKSKLFTKSKRNQSEKYYTSSEAKLMIKKSEGWFRIMLLTYLNTGIRTGEGLSLKWSDINFEKRTVTIQRSMRKGNLKEGTKTGKDREIRLPLPLSDELLAYKEICTSDIWLFPNETTGKPYFESNSIIKWYFKPLLKSCNIEYKTLYALRHTFASLSAQQNIPMSLISKVLGHSSVNVTMSFYIKNNIMADDENSDIFDKLYA
ncbi:MAG: tyrosine-type recombinase/integrase [Sulfurovum sp.]|nr:tyrosine-type recombinase/integrase [Sulfurovum sp.]